MAPSKPYQLLEITIMSAQDLQPVTKKIKTYATAWLHENRKLSTRIDNKGNNNPTWNDKFVFRVDDEFLHSQTSAVTVEIYSTHWLRDSLIGTVRVLVGNLVTPSESSKTTYGGGIRCVALQVRRPSGRTQGVLNIGAAVLDGSMRSLPLYRNPTTSAVGFHDLMEMEDNESQYGPMDPPLKLFRSKSDSSSMLDGSSIANSSMVAPPLKIGKPGSILSESEIWGSLIENGKNGKLDPILPQEEPKTKPNGKKLKKAHSIMSNSTFSANYIFRPPPKPYSMTSGSEMEPNSSSEIWGSLIKNGKNGKLDPISTQEKPKPKPNGKKLKNAHSIISNSTFNANYIFRPPPKPYSMLSGSEMQPNSTSEAMATMERSYPLEDDMNSSILDSWSINESEEGLRTKLDRWRSELPPLYDQRFSSSTSSAISQRKKEHTDEGHNGVFSIFGNICGYECQCVCGQPSSAKTTKAKSRDRRQLRSSSSIGSGSSRSSSSLSFF